MSAPDLTLYSLPTQLPRSQADLYVPSQAEVYGWYLHDLIAFLVVFFVLLNFVLKVKT